jgi:hypothetical protein
MLYTPTADHHDGLISLLGQRWRAWKEQRDNLAGLESCGRGEVARIAHDLSLSPGELRSLANKGPDSADLVYRRMADLGLDRDAIARSEARTFWDLQKNCSLCESKGRCRHDFARGAETSAWHAYCPNDDTLSALATAGTHGIRPSATRATVVSDDGRGTYASVLGLLLVTLAWLVLLAAPPLGVHSNLRRLAPIATSEAAAVPAPSLACLDSSCLSVQQQSALRDLRAVQAQGWIATSPDQLASLPQIATLAQGVHAGEALTCTRQGGSTFYGFMFERGCSKGGSEAAKLEGYNECRPMAGGGVCLLK